MKTLCTTVFLLCALIGVWLGQKPKAEAYYSQAEVERLISDTVPLKTTQTGPTIPFAANVVYPKDSLRGFTLSIRCVDGHVEQLPILSNEAHVVTLERPPSSGCDPTLPLFFTPTSSAP